MKGLAGPSSVIIIAEVVASFIVGATCAQKAFRCESTCFSHSIWGLFHSLHHKIDVNTCKIDKHTWFIFTNLSWWLK